MKVATAVNNPQNFPIIIRLGGPYLPDLRPKLPGEMAPIVFAGMFSTLGTTLPGFSRHKVNLFYQVK